MLSGEAEPRMLFFRELEMCGNHLIVLNLVHVQGSLGKARETKPQAV